MTESGNGHPRDRLSEYLDDALEIEARELVDRHLAACEDCRAELSAMRRLKSAVAEESVPPVPPELLARIGRSLDEATVARPRFRSFLPATIAATIGAVGLLVALQWREGHFVAPSVSRPEEKTRALDELKPQDQPMTPAAPDRHLSEQPPPALEKEAAAREHLDRDFKRAEEPVVDERFKQKKDEAAPKEVTTGAASGVEGGVEGGVPGGVPGGVVGGVVGGVQGGVEQAEGVANSGSANEERQRAAADDARRDTGSSKVPTRAAAAPPEPSARMAPAPLAGKGMVEADRSCAERWSDSGLRGSWDVPDVDDAERQLGRVAHAVGGIGLWRGVADGKPYIVVVPREHFDEVVYALRARGVGGFPETPPPSEGTDCAGIFITLKPVPAAGAPR